MTSHRLALKLIASQPKHGKDVAAFLVNYDHMIEGAERRYDTSAQDRAANDAAYEAYTVWQRQQAGEQPQAQQRSRRSRRP